jgi:hypothetical protein
MIATFLPFFTFGISGKYWAMSSLKSAATLLSLQIATGSSSILPLLQAGSQGLSQVLPKTPGKTLDSQLTI